MGDGELTTEFASSVNVLNNNLFVVHNIWSNEFIYWVIVIYT